MVLSSIVIQILEIKNTKFCSLKIKKVVSEFTVKSIVVNENEDVEF